MRHTWLRTAIAAVFLFSGLWMAPGGQAGNSGTASQNHAVIATRLFTGADGQSHIGKMPIEFKPVQSGQPEYTETQKMSDGYIVRAAPGYFEPWHNADKKRYIVVISGEAEITTTGGEKARIVPGQLYLAEDLIGKGHTFRVVGQQEWVALFVNFAQ